MAYISFIITHIFYKLHFFHDLDHVWAASMYCIYTCLSDLWVLIHVLAVLLLFLYGLESQMFHFIDSKVCFSEHESSQRKMKEQEDEMSRRRTLKSLQAANLFASPIMNHLLAPPTPGYQITTTVKKY
jgi:hypothetical protein